jgi:hypothetical protein
LREIVERNSGEINSALAGTGVSERLARLRATSPGLAAITSALTRVFDAHGHARACF